jgi:hypothetical protein
MLVQMINRLLELAGPKVQYFHSLPYSDTELQLVRPPRTEGVTLSTLTGLVDAIRAGLDGIKVNDWLLVVHDFNAVSLVARKADPFGTRQALITTALNHGEPFPFGLFRERGEFVIGLLSKFVPGGDLDKVLQLASSLQASSVTVAEDDGVSQKTTVKQGVVLKEQVIVKGRVSLRPYRTFREVEQPMSDFVFRLRSQQGEVPQCALFEADGKKWKLDAVLTIKAWLDAQNLGIPVVA